MGVHLYRLLKKNIRVVIAGNLDIIGNIVMLQALSNNEIELGLSPAQ